MTTSSVGAAFGAIVAAHPASVAVRAPGTTWTYAELGDEVHRVARGVTQLVGGPERRVAVLAAHDAPLVAAVLGVIAAGNVVLVLDAMAPEPERRHVLLECSPEVLLHDAPHAELAHRLADQVPLAALEPLDGPPSPAPLRSLDDPAMLAMTSGTSGDSKAAVITHGVLLTVVAGAVDRLGVDERDCLPMLFPLSLAVASYPMFIPLLVGGTLAVLDVRSVGLAPLPDFLIDQGVTVAYLAPTVVRFLTDAVGDRAFPDLRLVALGGEVVTGEVARLTAQLFGCGLLANGFGTTETGIIALEVAAPSDLVDGPMASGRPVDGVELSIVDDEGVEVAPGEAGEIVVEGAHLFAGYLGHADLTAAVLRDVPGRPGWRRYRTGDLGRLVADGRLQVLGRSDAVVKVRGRAVVLDDVEAAIRELEPVVDAVVTTSTGRGVTELIATVVLRSPTDDVDQLRSALLVERASFEVPSRWRRVDALPRLPNGKVDRQRATADAVTAVAPEPVADADVRLEQELIEIWQVLLPAESVGLDDDFLALGGDSLLAAQMVVLVEQRLGVIVPMGELIHARTVRDLAQVVRRSSPTGPASFAARVSIGDPVRPRLWFVPDLQGSAYRVRHLAHHLGPDQPLWSFESPLMFGERNPFDRLDAFATRLLADLRAVQPSGPYWLAGYSFGGIVAYEMARQLTAIGEQVAFLGVVDVGPGYRGPGWAANRSPGRPWFGVAHPPPPGASPAEAARHYRDMWRSGPARLARHLMVRSGLARVVDPLRFRADLARHGRVRPEWRLWYAWEEHWKLAARFWDRSSTYAGRVDLFWAADSGSTDSSMGWAPLVGELVVHRFPGDHDSLLEPSCAPMLAASLRSVIDDRLAADGS